MHFVESREKQDPQVHPGVGGVLFRSPEGVGQRQAELPPQLAAAKGRLARPPQVLWTCEREEEGKGGYEKQERRRETALDAWEEHGWPHQEAFWFW